MKKVRRLSAIRINEGLSDSGKFVPRDEMMELIKKKFPNIWVKPSEEFSKDKNYAGRGIWSGAESSTWIDNEKKIPAFNPSGAYAYDSKINKNYDNEVHKTLSKFLKDDGWYAEFYDNATVFFWPITPSDTNESKVRGLSTIRVYELNNALQAKLLKMLSPEDKQKLDEKWGDNKASIKSNWYDDNKTRIKPEELDKEWGANEASIKDN